MVLYIISIFFVVVVNTISVFFVVVVVSRKGNVCRKLEPFLLIHSFGSRCLLWLAIKLCHPDDLRIPMIVGGFPALRRRFHTGRISKVQGMPQTTEPSHECILLGELASECFKHLLLLDVYH